MSELNPPRIKPLPPLLVNQLAAGEIVTRPASVVKELIENAIDAGATHIEIKVTQGGMGIIEVGDDGFGIHPDDMIMAVTRHATSKIADVASLQGIRTLGFRGEALASTAAVSRLTLTSCHDDSGIGRQLSVAGIIDDQPILTPVVHSQGTTVTVKDLYFNVPARRANLKSIATEFAHIETVVQALALAVSHVNIVLWHNNKKRFSFAAITPNHSANLSTVLANAVQSKQILQRLGNIIATKLATDCIVPLQINLAALINEPHYEALFSGTGDIGVSGLLFVVPSSNRATAQSTQSLASLDQPKLIYINGRLIKDTRIAQLIKEAMTQINAIEDNSNKPLIASLGYVLFFTLPLPWLNVNVHPSKQRIGIQHLPNILAHLKVNLLARLRRWQKDYQPSYRDENKQAVRLNPNPKLSQVDYKSSLNLLNDNQHNSCPINISEHSANYGVGVNETGVSQSKWHQPSVNNVKMPNKLLIVPRCVACVDKEMLASLTKFSQKTPKTPPKQSAILHSYDPINDLDTGLSKRIDKDIYLLLQDSEGFCVIGLQAIMEMLQFSFNQPHLAQLQPAIVENFEQLVDNDATKLLAVINSCLDQWYVHTDCSSQFWQQFIEQNSVVHLTHRQLINKL